MKVGLREIVFCIKYTEALSFEKNDNTSVKFVWFFCTILYATKTFSAPLCDSNTLYMRIKI